MKQLSGSLLKKSGYYGGLLVVIIGFALWVSRVIIWALENIGIPFEAANFAAGIFFGLIAVSTGDILYRRIRHDKESKSLKSNYFKRYGYGPTITIVGLCLALWFVVFYGERLNPWDGKTWSDFGKETTQFGCPAGQSFNTTSGHCEEVPAVSELK